MGRGQSAPPKTSDQEISADLPGKGRQGKKGKWSKKEGKSKKEDGKLKMEGGKVTKWQVNFFFTFKKHWNFFWVYQNGNFLPGKSILHWEKKSGKMTLPPLKNIPLTPLTLMPQRSEGRGQKKVTETKKEVYGLHVQVCEV